MKWSLSDVSPTPALPMCTLAKSAGKGYAMMWKGCTGGRRPAARSRRTSRSSRTNSASRSRHSHTHCRNARCQLNAALSRCTAAGGPQDSARLGENTLAMLYADQYADNRSRGFGAAWLQQYEVSCALAASPHLEQVHTEAVRHVRTNLQAVHQVRKGLWEVGPQHQCPAVGCNRGVLPRCILECTCKVGMPLHEDDVAFTTCIPVLGKNGAPIGCWLARTSS
jgi:hypothetical protein